MSKYCEIFLYKKEYKIKDIKKRNEKMKKPAYYLWKNDFKNEEEYIKTKEILEKSGFRIVVYLEEKERKKRG